MQMTHLRSNFTSLHSYLNFFFFVLQVSYSTRGARDILTDIPQKQRHVPDTGVSECNLLQRDFFLNPSVPDTGVSARNLLLRDFFFWILVSWSLPSYRYPVVIEVHVVYLKSNDMSLAAIHAKLLTDIASMLQVYVYFFFRDFFSCQRYRRSMLQVYIYLILFGFSFVSMISPQHASGACLSRLFFCWFFLWYRLHASGVCLFSIVFYFDIACLCVEGYMPRPPLQEGHK